MGMLAGRRILGLRLQTQEVLDLTVSILDLIACFLYIQKAQGQEVSRRGEVRLPKKTKDYQTWEEEGPRSAFYQEARNLDTQHNFQKRYLILIMFQSIIYTSLGYMPRSGVTGSYGRSDFSFWRIHHTGYTSLHPTHSELGFHSLHPSQHLLSVVPLVWNEIKSHSSISMPLIVKDG